MSRRLAAFAMSSTCLRRSVADHVLGREVVVDVDAELALAGVLGQVADVAVGGQDAVVVAQIALDRPRLGRRFDDHEVLWHGRECSTGSFTRPLRRSRRTCARALAGRAGRTRRQTSRMRRRKSSSISRSALVGRSAGAAGDGHRAGTSSRPASAGRRPASDARRDLDEPDVEVREEEDRVHVVDEDRPLAVHRAQVRAAQRRRRSAIGSSNRSASSGCSLLRWRTTLRITAASWRREAVPSVGPMVRSRGGRSR